VNFQGSLFLQSTTMQHFKSLAEIHKANGFRLPENPLFSLVRCDKTCSLTDKEATSDFYTIVFKKVKAGAILYGRTAYDHENGSIFFMSPRQVIEFRNLTSEEAGFVFFFHEDYLIGHPLYTEIKKYGYFDYEANEALHVSPAEEKTLWELFHKIETEYYNNQDEYSREIILSHMDSILKYSQRFYKRQFINRTILSGKMVSKFHDLLSAYFTNGSAEITGMPTVNYMASTLHVSPRYLSDLLKEETGKTAIELIHIFLISEAKNRLKTADLTVGEIAYTLGFENLPYFSRLFKREVGVSPNQYKKQSAN
jgi:AraC family transcriptional activator of pobA